MVGFFNFTDGANPALSPFLMPATALNSLVNCNVTHNLGAITKELGYSRVGGVIRAGKDVNTIYDFRATSANQRYLATVNNAANNATELWQYTGSWAEITAAESAWNIDGVDTEFETFIGFAFAVGYSPTDNDYIVSASINSSGAFSTSTNVTNMPRAKYIRRYRDRLYIANCKVSSTVYPFRVYFSTIPSAGAISWQSVDFVDVDFAEDITGIEVNFDRLFIFTESNTYFYDQTQLKLAWDIGCPSHRTLATTSVNLVWANQYGVWVSEQGGYPTNIGGPIIDYLRASTNPSAWFSEMIEEEYWLYIGSVTVDGETYFNACWIFNFPTSSWRLRLFPNPIISFGRALIGGQFRNLMGDTNGQVWNYSKYTDATPIYADEYVNSYSTAIPIPSKFELAAFKLETYDNEVYIDQVVAYAKKAAGVNVMARVIDNSSRALTDYRSLGQLKSYQEVFTGRNVQGTLIQLKGTEVSKNPPWEFYGVEVNLRKNSDLPD
jgi:hypothetical protein